MVAFYERLVEEVRGIPGVEIAGAVTCPPLSCHQGRFTVPEGVTLAPDAHVPVNAVLFSTPGYMEAIGFRRTAGRSLDASDVRAGAPIHVVVNEAYAKWAWPGIQDPVGRRMKLRGDDAAPWWTVVGVVADARHYGLDEPPRPTIYLPYASGFATDASTSLAVVMRSAVESRQVLASARAVVRRLDPSPPLYEVSSMAAKLEDSLQLDRAFAWLLASCAGIALVLAVGGIYSVLSYIVSRRVPEIGIRLALGASRRRVVGMIVAQGAMLVAAGVVLAVPLALSVGKVIELAPQTGVGVDALTLGVPSVLLEVTGALSALLPAYRAVGVSPRESLR
jgi:hypothetical protein